MATDEHKVTTPTSGSLFAFLSGCFSSFNVILMGLLYVSVTQLMFLRSLFQLLSCFVIICNVKSGIRVPRDDILMLFGRSLTNNVAYYLLFFSAEIISKGEAMTLFMTCPALTTIFAFFFIKESCPKLNMLYVVVNLVGGLVICSQSSEYHSGGLYNFPTYVGYITAFMSAVAIAVSAVFARTLGNVPSIVVCLYTSLLGVVLWALPLVAMKEWLDYECGYHGLFIILNGVCGAGVDGFIVLAFKRMQAGHVSIVRSSDIVVTFLLEIAIFSRFPTVEDIVGAFLVLFSVGATVLCSCKNSKKWYGGMIPTL